MNLSALEWNNLMELEKIILKLLKEAFSAGDPQSDIAMRACELHKEWLCLQRKEGTYTKEAHLALTEGYVADKRFTAYYDKLGPGCTEFFRDAIKNYVG
ncbi:MAG: TipAS antibiotic-recognition domain-containing protein [Lachnospiraceae bacterium]|nr:TipAS antibiotic-recognition domain-containing protein [Lachnospiraceae bacterium]